MKRTVIAIAAAWMAFAAAVHAADLEFLFVGDDGSDAVVVPSLGTNLAVNAKLVCGGTNKVAGVFAKVACSGDLGLLSIGGESAAFNGNSVSTNISLSSAAVFNLDNGFDPACAIDGETAFQLKIDVPAGTTNGTYSVGFSELQVFKNGSGDRWTTSFRPLTVVVGTPSPSTYFDPTTHTTNTCEVYTRYTGQTTLTSGWYVVGGNMTNDTRITINGDAHLILADGAYLKANKGINVEVKNNVTNCLTVWAQSDGANMGSLTATATFESGDAGIGGGYGGTGGTVTINGGKVTATGGECAAGIGGGYGGTGGTVTINGGKVTATGGNLGAGIGVGLRGSDVAVTINGGKVEAKGCPGGAGIGGGMEGSCGTVTINGGNVEATGGNDGAGIGGGSSGTGWTVTINGGKVEAKGSSGGTGIGGGSSGSGWTVTINGGEVTATGNSGGAGIGGGWEGSGVMVTVNGGEVTATCTDGGAGIGGGWEGSGVTVTVNGGQVTAQSRLNGAGIGGGYNGSGVTVTIAGGEVTATGGEGDGIGGAGCETVIKPAGGKMIAVAAGANAGSAVAVAGSPFAAETDVTGRVKGQRFVHVGKAFEEGDIALADYAGVYDGEGHTIGIATNAIPGLVLRYSSPSSPSTTLPLFTNVCDMVVYVEASAPGYVTFTTNATVKITKASLKITARDQTYRYNGLQQGESDPIYATPEEIAEKVIVNGLKGGDTIDHVELGGEATEAGWYPIEPRGAVVVNPNNGDVTGNYDINYVNGTLTILGEATVSNVVAASNEPWDGKVQIAFNVTNSPAACLPDWNKPFLSIVATDNLTGSNYVSFASALSGDTDTADGVHMVEWDMGAQGLAFASTNVTFTVAYLRMPDWCVIDLSGGKDAVSYPIAYLDAVADPAATFNTDAYKTTNLVMRLIGPGTFEMGESGSTETTEITNAFYCAVFETTQRQWELVTGNRPSWFTNETYYATRPVEQVSWNMIRGDADTYNWPDVQGVASDSFVGVLRQKTGLAALDLPAEAQWEYACRAGTTTDYNNGKNWSGNNPCPNMDVLGRYGYNGGLPDPDHYEAPAQGCETDLGTAAVGSYDPNKWGLYDMHGNVWEWCLERYSFSRLDRVRRGGSWCYLAVSCTSSYRFFNYPSDVFNYGGFRLVRTLSNDFESERSAEAAAGAERAGTVCAGTASKPIRVGKDFTADDIALADYSGTYDGEGHTIGIATNAIDGLVLRYSSPSSPMSPSSPFTTLPLFTNVCDMVVYVEASAPGYFTFTTNASVKITKASLKITARDQTYRYNGLQQGESDTIYATPEQIAEKVVVEGLKGGDMLASIELDGQGTDAGTYPIEPSQASVANGGSTVTGNYDINYVNGTLTILGEAAVSDVQAASSEPWNGKVQIAFNVTNSPAACLPDWNMPFLSIVATDNETGSNYVADVSALSGDTDTADGAHMVTWDMDGQGIKFYSTNVTFTVAYLSRQLNDYCVIDLSCGEQGTGDARCPVSYLDAPPEGGWTDAYRTTNLVLRLVRPGTFTMGSTDPEDPAQDMDAHEVTISSPFYIGVFETTQWQWRQVTGGNPSQTPGDTHPVERVSYNMARGASWPSSTDPSSDSFLGMLRSMTGIDFDLPLEEQWEYACRAGTTTKYNSGDDDEASMNNLGRYEDNRNDGKGGGETHAAVGSYAPNAWGIYDMHGNVCEWCLDWYDLNSTRVRRGGSWLYGASGCTSYFRARSFPTSKYSDYGFRLCCSVGGENGAGEPFVVCSGASEPTTAGKKPAAELAAELKWKHLKATGTYFAQLKLTCTNWLDSGISDLRFMFADRVGADGKTSAALWSTPLRSANTNVEESAGTTYRFVALDESLIEEENTPVVYGVADLSATTIPVAERTIEMYVRTGVAPEGQNAASAQVDDFVGYVCWTSSDEACAVPVVASGVNAGHMFGAVRPLAGASLPSPKMLNESLALGVPVVEGSSPYCRVTEFSVGGERIKGRIEVGAGENVGSLGANATVTVLGAASPAGPFETLGAVETEEDGSFSLVAPEDAQFFKLRIDVKEVVR